MDVGAISLILDVLKNLRELWKEKKQGDIRGADSFMALHISTKRLISLTNDLADTIEASSSSITPFEESKAGELAEEALEFVLAVVKINREAIEVHAPELAKTLKAVHLAEDSVFYEFTAVTTKKPDKRILRALDALNRIPGGPNLVITPRALDKMRVFPRASVNKKRLVSDLRQLSELLEHMRRLLAEIIRENWTLRELLE